MIILNIGSITVKIIIHLVLFSNSFLSTLQIFSVQCDKTTYIRHKRRVHKPSFHPLEVDAFEE